MYNVEQEWNMKWNVSRFIGIEPELPSYVELFVSVCLHIFPYLQATETSLPKATFAEVSSQRDPGFSVGLSISCSNSLLTNLLPHSQAILYCLPGTRPHGNSSAVGVIGFVAQFRGKLLRHL